MCVSLRAPAALFATYTALSAEDAVGGTSAAGARARNDRRRLKHAAVKRFFVGGMDEDGRPPAQGCKGSSLSGAGLTGMGPGLTALAAFSSLGVNAPTTRWVSETQPAGASTVGPVPGPAIMCTT